MKRELKKWKKNPFSSFNLKWWTISGEQLANGKRCHGRFSIQNHIPILNSIIPSTVNVKIIMSMIRGFLQINLYEVNDTIDEKEL